MADPERSNPALDRTVLSSSIPSVPGPGDAPDPLLGSKLRHFEVIELLGRGGMGAVYLGHDTSLDRPVALKVLAPAIGRDPELVHRFEREAQAQARLRHPNVTQLYFIGEEGGLHFFAMEYIEGESLGLVLDRGERVPWAQAIEYAISVARGLREALAQGFIHRDIKPSNLLRDKDGQVKIADFGLAKSMKGDVELTREGVIVGSPLYMAPEQGRAENVDHRSDIYALGCALYHLLAGAPPFTAPTPVGVITKHVTDRAASIRGRCPDVPEALERIVARMMAKDPAARYPTYDELIAALEAIRPGRQEFSGFFTRAMALLIDFALLVFASGFIGNYALGLWAAYLIVAQRLRGATLGKWLLRLQVLDVTGKRMGWRAALGRFLVAMWGPILWGSTAALLFWRFRHHEFAFTFDQLVEHHLVAGIVYASAFGLTFLGYLAGYLMAAFHPKKRALHDLLANTVVVYKFPS